MSLLQNQNGSSTFRKVTCAESNVQHLVSSRTGAGCGGVVPPTVLADADGSGGGVATLYGSSTDVAGGITLTVPNTAQAGPVLTVTFGTPYNAPPIVIVTPASVFTVDEMTNSGAINNAVYAVADAAGFTLFTGSQELTDDAESYEWVYHVIGV
jgi:hypothetical protein